MYQITQNFRTGKVSLEEVPIPLLKGNGLLVQNSYSLVSVGTEKMLMDLGSKSLLGKAKDRPDKVEQVMKSLKQDGLISTLKKVQERLDTPIPMGYSSAGIVIDKSSSINDIEIGDKVVCYGEKSGAHANVVYVPKNCYVKVDKDMDLKQACFGGVGAIALQGIRQLNPQLGDTVVVIGLGLIGQITSKLLLINGCKVIGIDMDDNKVALLINYGALGVNRDNEKIEDIILSHTEGNGVDGVIITAATKSNDPVKLAAKIARDRAKVISLGLINMDIPRNEYYLKELSVDMARSFGPGTYDSNYIEKGSDYPIGYIKWTSQRNVKEIADLIYNKKLNINELITHEYDFKDAEKAYGVLSEGSDKLLLGIVFKYEEINIKGDNKKIFVNYKLNSAQKGEADIKIGFIGAGNFASTYLLPRLRNNKDISLIGIANASGISSKNVAKRNGFKYCTTDYNEILSDGNINTVFIATRHNLHADQLIEAMKKEKNIFIEKPLALNKNELEQIVDTYKNYKKRIIFVGYNRRFSSHAVFLKEKFKNKQSPMIITYRVNAGVLPVDSWIQDQKEGGDRIIGEACHFVDLFQYFIESDPLEINTESIISDNPDYPSISNIIVSIKYKDGSLGNIVYHTLGDPSFPRERVEIFTDKAVGVIDNYKNSLYSYRGKIKIKKTINQDLGYDNEIRIFVEWIKNPVMKVFNINDLINTSVITFKTKESFHKNIKFVFST